MQISKSVIKRDRLQTKTKHCNMIFNLIVIYIITIKLSFRIKKGFRAWVENS